MNIKGVDVNCTTIFLLPGIGLQGRSLVQKYGFIEAYIEDKNHEIKYRDSIYLLYKPKDVDNFQEFLNSEYKRTPLLVEDYDYKGGYIVTVYKFPEEFISEYKNFLIGKYSKFRKKYILKFPERVDIIGENGTVEWRYSLAYHIFNRTQAIKGYWANKIFEEGEEFPDDFECWSAPDMEKEILDIEKIKKRII